MNITQLAVDHSTAIAAIAIGIFWYKKLDKFFRLLFFQVLIYLIVDSTAFIVSHWYENAWIYNIHLPIETLLLTWAAGVCFNNSKSRLALSVLFGVFLLIFMIDIFILTGFTTIANHALVAENVLMTGIFSMILYVHFQKKNNVSIILVSIGIMVYFACSIPFLSMIQYFQEKNPSLNKNLFQVIVVLPAAIRYLFLAIAFYLVNKNQRAAILSKP